MIGTMVSASLFKRKECSIIGFRCASAQRQAAVGVVQIVGRQDADVVGAVLIRAAAQLLQAAVEALDLGEAAHVAGERGEQTGRVVRVDSGYQAVAGVPDRPEVARGDIAGDANRGEIFRLMV